MIRNSFWVVVLTAMGYAGFFLRDALSARYFGLGEPVALFQLSSFLPLFFASVLSAPLFSSLVPVLARRDCAGESAEALWAGQVTGVIGACFALVALTVSLLAIAYGAMSSVVSAQWGNYSLLVLVSGVVLALSGPLVAGNAMLSVGGHSALAMGAQAVVPAVAIAALFFWHKAGAWSLAGGALAGQLVNLYLVWRALRGQGLPFVFWRWKWPPPLNREFVTQYGALVAAGLILGVNQPLGIWLSERQGVEAVAAFALGSKAMVLLNSLTWVVVAYVVLPHFSRLLKQGMTANARRELAGALWFGLISTIPLALLAAEMAIWIVRLFFEGGRFSSSDTELVAKVMGFGVLQLPALVMVLILLKFATAEGRATRVLWMLPLGLLFNVWISTFLMASMGVAGVALGGSLAVGLSALFMLARDSWAGLVSLRDALALALLLLLHAGLGMAWLHGSAMGMWVVGGVSVALALSRYLIGRT